MTREPLWIIEHKKGHGSGGFLSPPGHPAHEYSLTAYWGGRRKQSGPDLIGGIEYALDPDSGAPEHIKAQVRQIMKDSELACSEEWVSQVYGYFKNSYSPDGTDRNVSNAITTSKVSCKCGEDFWGRKSLNGHIDRARAAAKGPKGRPVRGNAGHYEVAKPTPPAEHHLGYLCVKSYFPDHTPRLDLIESGGGYGTRECIKCSKRVQYEAGQDAWAEVLIKGGLWAGTDPSCPKGGKHEVRPHNGPCENCGCSS